MPLKIEEPICVAATGDACGEGIVWEQETQSIYWSDINRFLIHRYVVKDRTLRTWFFSEPVTTVMLTSRPGTLALTLGSGLALWQPESERPPDPMFSLPGWPFVRCNDAGVDPAGTLWLGSMRNNVGADGSSAEAGGRDGVLYRVHGNGTSSEQRRDLGISNTLLWSPDRSRFYFGDSLENCIWSWDYNLKDQTIRGEKPFFHGFDRGLPDGSAIDTDGYIWNCRYDGGCIVRVAPDGTIDRVIEMPVSRPTNCTFAGSVLYITCAYPEPGRWERFGGCLFAMQTNVTGVAENKFTLP
jgi:sugar lactone lactonase YvrE